MKKPALQYVVLVALLAWATVAQFTFSGFMLYVQTTTSSYTRVPFITRQYTAEISNLLPSYEDSGLRVGDRILQLNGQPVRGLALPDRMRFELHPGDTLNVKVQRAFPDGHSETLDIPVRMHLFHSAALGWVNLIALDILLPFSCLLVGFFIAFRRPTDPLAWITMAMLVSFGALAGSPSYWAITPPWRETFIFYHSIRESLWPLWLVLFALYFPVPFAFVRRHGWLNWPLALPFLVLATLTLYGDLLEGDWLQDLSALARFFQSIQTPSLLLDFICVIALPALLMAKRRGLPNPDAGRRLNVMVAGCSLAVLPILWWMAIDIGLLREPPEWIGTVALLLLLFFPATMAYVIIVQRAMDVRMVIRTGVQYAVASTGLQILRTIAILAVITLTVLFALESEHRWQAVLIGVAGAIAVSGLGHALKNLSKWIDRRFFREAYNAEIVLTELGNTVSGIRDTKSLLETVTQRVSNCFHALPMAILLEKGDCFVPVHCIGYPSKEVPVEFKKNGSTLRFLRTLNAPAKVYFDDPQSWVYGIAEAEQGAIQTLHCQILIPIVQQSRMLGIFSLGPKRSEAPYSRADLQLMSAVASQTGLALENARLTENIRREIAQRARLNRELEIAREVQQHLFPQKLPEVRGLDFAGYCRPALGVGGDYYDFILLDDGCLGIAIGDVSGKGIAAALTMASLQASLRSQTLTPSPTLGEMIRHINRLVFEASADNRYATFFYAQYEPASRVLRYVNARHNAPILCRTVDNCEQIHRLQEVGMVIGLFPQAPYEETRMTLLPGDLLIGFTDGISEAMNAADEEFSEERLMETMRFCERRSAADMIKCILDKVDAFTAAAPQHDDMTLLVVRVQ